MPTCYVPDRVAEILDVMREQTGKTHTELLLELAEHGEAHKICGYSMLTAFIPQKAQHFLDDASQTTGKPKSTILAAILTYASEHKDVISELFPSV